MTPAREAMARVTRRGDISVVHDLTNLTIPHEYRDSSCAVIYDPMVAHLHPDLLERLVCLAARVCLIALEATEPRALDIDKAGVLARRADARLVVSVGGGSTIDTAKGVAQILGGRRNVPEAFERPGSFQFASPHIAIPTTAGPGAEVSPAMVFSNTSGRKIAIVDERLVPQEVVIVPQLAVTLPRYETACCILDGIAHSLEGAFRADCTPAAYSASVVALRGLLETMWAACENLHDVAVRERLAMLSILSGEGLRMTSVGAVHALAGAVSDIVHAPHGAIVGGALVAVLDDDMTYRDGRSRLNQLAIDAGFDDAAGLTKSIGRYWNAFASKEFGHPTSREDDVAKCCEVALADPRLGMNGWHINARSAERAIRRVLANVAD